jgi:hypothetical protein
MERNYLMINALDIDLSLPYAIYFYSIYGEKKAQLYNTFTDVATAIHEMISFANEDKGTSEITRMYLLPCFFPAEKVKLETVEIAKIVSLNIDLWTADKGPEKESKFFPGYSF